MKKILMFTDANNRDVQAFVLGGPVHTLTLEESSSQNRNLQNLGPFDSGALIEMDVSGSCMIAAGKTPDASDPDQSFTISNATRTYGLFKGHSLSLMAVNGPATVVIRESGHV